MVLEHLGKLWHDVVSKHLVIDVAQDVHLFTRDQIFEKHHSYLNSFGNYFRLLSWFVVSSLKYLQNVGKDLLQSDF